MIFCFSNEVIPGFTVGVVVSPVNSNFPTHIPDSSSSPKVNAGWVNQLPLVEPFFLGVVFDTKFISIVCGLISSESTLNSLYSYLGI